MDAFRKIARRKDLLHDLRSEMDGQVREEDRERLSSYLLRGRGLDKIPNELLAKILCLSVSYNDPSFLSLCDWERHDFFNPLLNIRDVLPLRLVSRRFRDAIDNTGALWDQVVLDRRYGYIGQGGEEVGGNPVRDQNFLEWYMARTSQRALTLDIGRSTHRIVDKFMANNSWTSRLVVMSLYGRHDYDVMGVLSRASLKFPQLRQLGLCTFSLAGDTTANLIRESRMPQLRDLVLTYKTTVEVFATPLAILTRLSIVVCSGCVSDEMIRFPRWLLRFLRVLPHLESVMVRVDRRIDWRDVLMGDDLPNDIVSLPMLTELQIYGMPNWQFIQKISAKLRAPGVATLRLGFVSSDPSPLLRLEGLRSMSSMLDCTKSITSLSIVFRDDWNDGNCCFSWDFLTILPMLKEFYICSHSEHTINVWLDTDEFPPPPAGPKNIMLCECINDHRVKEAIMLLRTYLDGKSMERGDQYLWVHVPEPWDSAAREDLKKRVESSQSLRGVEFKFTQRRRKPYVSPGAWVLETSEVEDHWPWKPVRPLAWSHTM